MRVTDIDRIAAFEDRFARAQATQVVDLSWGVALLQADFPLSHDHNRITVSTAVDAAEVLTAAEELLGGAGLEHRYVSVDSDELGQALRAEFEAAGYEHETIVTMVYSGPNVPPAAHVVQAVSLDMLGPAIICDWRDTLPDATEEELGQLADRTALYARGAELTRLAVFEGDEIAAHADLYLDRIDTIAQFENLVTHKNFRGRGYGRSLISDALRRGHLAGRDLSYLTARLDDWPYRWYHRLGYVDARRTHHFSRLA